MVDVPSKPMLATVPGVELGSVGYWDISNATGWHPTADDFAAAIAALDCPAVRRPVLKFGHTGEGCEGDPSIGLVDNLRLTDDGQTLIGDFVGIPAWLAEADSEGRSVLASSYPDRSGEWQHDYVCQLGHTHPFVLHAMALLGVVRPGIGTLESLYDLFTKAPEKEVAVAKSTVALAGTTIDQVRKAYYEAEPDYYLWIREMYVDPPELIVQNDHDDSLERVPYTVTGDGEVEFGEGQGVKVEYVAARAASEKPTMAFASRTEARPASSPTDPSAAQAEETDGKEGAMPTLKEGLAQKLGISADADDEAVLTAFTEALAANSADSTEGGAEAAPEVSEATPEQIAAAAQRFGLTVLDSEVASRLTADAAAGREARDRQQREDDAKVVDSAIGKGKITPARREHFLAMMSADREGTTTLLEKTLQESAVPLTELGHATEPVDNVTDNPAYKNWSF
ncbi:hypothetical protein M2272_005860 [Mycobacterium frederiksbergense]|uniref:Capsid maturation protease n=1 Tax=Mycolicibacterium frederiksbergense TaxID=117567 RepID=A0ABT6L8B0_9MYCO|nr:phage protease [Mycolicibacterium frederiksbergense]MDH6199192.1 hypothetical protein [Mycolicibacterium frederiksbergense]